MTFFLTVASEKRLLLPSAALLLAFVFTIASPLLFNFLTFTVVPRYRTMQEEKNIFLLILRQRLEIIQESLSFKVS